MSIKHRQIAGFTLFEMLVVLVILGLLAAMVSPKLRLNEGARIRSVTHALIVDLRLVRDEAIRRGMPTTIIPTTRGYLLQPSDRHQTLPDGYTLTVEPPAAQLLPISDGGVRFFPDGSSSGGMLTLHGGNSSIRVTVRGLDGKAQLRD